VLALVPFVLDVDELLVQKHSASFHVEIPHETESLLP
jgi:hypothetical protein